MSIGTSRKGSAHIVLWGEVRKDEGELYAKPRLTVTGQLGKAHMEETELKEFTSYDPKHIKFKERLANAITDIVTLVYGFAYYKVGNWNRAIEILNHVHSSCGYLYKGLSLIKRSHRVLSPQQDLRSAIENIEKTIDDIPRDLTLQSDLLTWVVYLNRAKALALLGTLSQPKEAHVYLQDAVKAYRAALQGYTKAEFPQDWAMTQANLGSALDDLGSRLDSKEGIRFIQESGKSYRDALQVYTKAGFPQDWAMTKTNLGITLTHLGIRMGAGEGIKLLRGAVEVHKAALQVRTRVELPLKWARTQTNLGIALTKLGFRIGGEEGVLYLNESIICFDDALSIYDSTSYPESYREILDLKSKVKELIRVLESIRRR